MEKSNPEIDFHGYDAIHSWAGRSIEWLVLEAMVFTFFSAALALLITRSRFAKIGNDSSY